ncbi:hypothetical protein AURDEDRAFT_115702 [Auricularia subglabra TFB-10046 SS5]|uniref:SAC3/GANP/THP3 conserved domain-containing protein n=1 Tax=Auricularia subglabra (strain TFB-10046 / SS5) TaxID=717982 RepID=J0WWP8_AURST|nr:hypothetical protein AURDEDRAFT_115702 [Auricularia subglabra TFB-10046 SS5]
MADWVCSVRVCGVGRRFQMKDQREAEKQRFIAEGLMQDSYKSYRLEDAITLVGLCLDMCPEFERHEREYQQNVDRWEAIDPEVRPRRINHERAVKAFTRPTQGTEPLPSDLRPLPVLQKTLDYLFHTLLAEHGLEATHDFIWDRTRAIRREFVIQRLAGPEVAEILERIARYHTICLFRFSHLEEAKFSIKQEREQLDKTLQSLLEVYADGQALGHSFPQAAEFLAFRDSRRAFYLAFDKIRMSKTPLEPAITDPSVIDIIDGFYEPAQQTALPTTVLSGIPIHSSLGAAPGAHVAKPRPGPIVRPYATSAFTEHAPAAPAPVASQGSPQTAANAFQSAPSAFAATPNAFAPSMPAPASAFPPPPGATSFFGPSNIFGKGPFGPQKTEPKLNPSASAFTPQWSATPAASAFTLASTSLSAQQAGVSDPVGGTAKPALAFSFPTSEQATKPTSSLAPSNLFASIKAPTPTTAVTTWSSSPSPWSSSNPLLARLGPLPAPSHEVPKAENEPAGEDAAARAEAEAEAAVAAAEAQAAEEEEAAAAAAEAEAREAQIMAEKEAARRAELQRRLEEEKERNRLREQELKALLQQREERRRAEEVEAELQRQAEMALAAAAEIARQQAEADALNAQMQEEMMRRMEMPLVAEEWDRARLLRKMWDRWTARAVEIALMLEQREQLAKRREEFRNSVKDLVAGMGGTPVERRILRMRKDSRPVSDEDRARALEEESQRHAKLWAPGSFLAGVQNLVGRIPLWEVWLSLASSDGASSAWLKTKFGVSTDKAPTDVHRIPVHNDTSKEFFSSPNSPGLIVLEVSHDPNADCQRLRKLVQAIPEHRHYAMSLLLIKFTGSEPEVAPVLKDYIQSIGHAGTLLDARILVLSATQDMDKQFTHAVSSLKLDLTGTLVQRVTVDNYANAFFSAWEVTLNSWIGLCTDSSGFNWTLYGPIMTALLPMLNEISIRLRMAVGVSLASYVPAVPTLDWKIATDSASAFQAALAFLSQPTLLGDPDAQLLKTQLAEAAEAGVEFPIYAFPERLSQLIAGTVRTSATRGAKHVYLPKGATADSVTEDFRALLQNQLAGLEGLIRYTLPSPPASPSQSPTYHNANGTAAATATATATATAKKRSMEDTEWEDDANFVLNGYAHTNGAAKRHKTNGNTTPSPTRSATSLMSVSPSASATSTKRGARLRAMMDKMRASLRGEDTFADTSV